MALELAPASKDAGHLREKDLNLEIAMLLRDSLLPVFEHPTTAYFTRFLDNDLDLTRRAFIVIVGRVLNSSVANEKPDISKFIVVGFLAALRLARNPTYFCFFLK